MATWSTRYGYTNMTVTATEDTVSTANNTSRVVVNVKLAPAGTQPVYNGYNQTLTVKVNSSTIGTKGFTYNIAVGKSLDLGTYTTTITHNADGSKTVPIVVSASGGGDSASISKSLELTKIARASSITGGWSWTIGNNTTVSISRASSSFTHTVYIDTWNKSTASWGNIRTITGVGTSVSSGFTASNIATMAQHLRNESATAGSIKTRIRIQTYSGTTAIGGVVSKEGTLTNISASTISSATATAHNGVPYTVTRQSSNGNITHELSYQFGTFNKKLTLANNASNTGTMSFNSTELDTIYKQVTGGLYGTGGFTLTTYIAGVQVKGTVSISNIRLNFDTAKVAPTINDAFTFSDTNASMVAITGSNQTAIQNKSTISVVIPANASTFKSGATGKTYSVTINGVEKTATYSASATTIAFGTVSAGSNTTIAVSITDSRGIKVSTTKTLVVYPYANPTVSGVMARANGFDDSTTIRATGAIASVSGKNVITSVHYRFKENTASAYGSYVALTPTLSGTNFSTNTVTSSFDNTKKYHVEFRIIDKVGTTTTNVVLLDSGKPIMFVDKKNKSVGIGKFPDFANTLEAEGDLRVGGHVTLSGTSAGITLNPSSGNAGIELGSTNAVSTPYIDFHSSGTTTDYDARIIATGGSSTANQGVLQFYANKAEFTNNISVNGSDIKLNNSLLQSQSDGSLKVTSPSGYIDIGPKNTSYCHIYTDRETFYFNKGLVATSGLSTMNRLDITNSLALGNNAPIYGKNTSGVNKRLLLKGADNKVHINPDVEGDIVLYTSTIPATNNRYLGTKSNRWLQGNFNANGVSHSTKSPGSGASIDIWGANSVFEMGLGANTNERTGWINVRHAEDNFANVFGTLKLQAGGSTTVGGSFSVSGSKNAIHPTRDGFRLTPAYETAESYLGDIGESKTDYTNEIKVYIETLFHDTVNTEVSYQVFLQSYGDGFVWVSERNYDHFIVKSSAPNIAFAWELKAKRRGYEEDRLVLSETTYEDAQKMEGLHGGYITQSKEEGVITKEEGAKI